MPEPSLARAAAQLRVALGFLTRLPVGAAGSLAAASWAFPVVGIVVGLAAALAFHLALWLALPPVLAAILAVGVALLLTGALHEDGLADLADGLGGGRDRAAKLAIMRDSRIGSYGALALLLALAIRASGILGLAEPADVLSGLVVAGMVGRAGMVVPLVLLRPTRTDGLAARLASIPPASAVAALAIAGAAAFLLLEPDRAAQAVAVGLAAAVVMAWLARRQVGGHTGDVLGATEVVVECAVLTALCG